MPLSSPTQDNATTGIDLRVDEQKQLLQRFASLDTRSLFERFQHNDTRYIKENESYNLVDGIVLHCMLRTHQPKRIIEIGCGMSSCMILDTNEYYLDNAIDCTFIDISMESFVPYLRQGDTERNTLMECPVQSVDTSVFAELEAGDILFIDSSHIYQEGSDVYDIIHRILPVLQPGVRIHFHDIFWDFRYPETWRERPWNEGSVVQQLLRQHPEYQVELFSSHLAQFHEHSLRQTFPNLQRWFGGSLWLTKTKSSRTTTISTQTHSSANWVRTPYVILFTERSGSSYLTTVLSHHPHVRAWHEILPVVRNTETQAFERTPALQSQDTVLDLLARLYAYSSPEIVSAGFKFKAPHQTNAYGEAIELLQNFPAPVRVIKLYRKNLLKQAISSLYHTQSITEGTNAFPSNGTLQKLYLPPQMLLKMLKILEDNTQALHHLADTFSMVLPVSYEDLLHSNAKVMKDIFGFLQVSTDAVPFSTLKKIMPDTAEECIENMDEVRAALRDTKWEQYLSRNF